MVAVRAAAGTTTLPWTDPPRAHGCPPHPRGPPSSRRLASFVRGDGPLWADTLTRDIDGRVCVAGPVLEKHRGGPRDSQPVRRGPYGRNVRRGAHHRDID